MRATIAAAFLLTGSLANGQDDDYLAALPPSDGPLEVQVGFNLVNITDVNEKEETIDFDGQIILSWMDPRLAYALEDYRPPK